MGASGAVQLRTCADWNWQDGSTDPETWRVRVTSYGPSRVETWLLSQSEVIFLPWGSGSGTTYRGRSPITWASVTARLGAEAERALADESSTAIANFIPTPAGLGAEGANADGDPERDPLAQLRADVAKARGRTMLMETFADGAGDAGGAPKRDWMPARLGPAPTAAQVQLAADAFERTLAATGTPPALFIGNADGTAQREAIRRWHLGTVLPIARELEWELSRKLETPVKLVFDSYPRDQVSRAQVASKLSSIEGVTMQQALEISGLIEADE